MRGQNPEQVILTGAKYMHSCPVFELKASGDIRPLPDPIFPQASVLNLHKERNRLAELEFRSKFRGETIELCHVDPSTRTIHPEGFIRPCCIVLTLTAGSDGKIHLCDDSERVIATLDSDGWTSDSFAIPSDLLVGTGPYYASFKPEPTWSEVKIGGRSRISPLATRRD